MSYIKAKKVIKGDIRETLLHGLSAYEVAVKHGYKGTEKDWIASLKGEKGDTGEQGIQGIRGGTGETGPQGEKGDKGDTGFSPSVTVEKHSGGTSTITVVDEDGTTSVDIVDGYIPVRGTDYWTEADKRELYELVLSEYPIAEEGEF